MEQDGWQIDHYVQARGHTGACYLVARKEGIPYYILAIVGTENKADIKTDLKVDKVYFAGSNPEEFVANAAKKDITNTEPKVHKGFNEFVQAGPSSVLRNPQQVNLSLPDLLRTDKTRKLFLTGHSLGGAAATIRDAHQLTGYMDSALKNYYDKRHLAVAAGIKLPDRTANKQDSQLQRVYVLPLANQLPANFSAEFWYMKEVLQDVYQKNSPGLCRS